VPEYGTEHISSSAFMYVCFTHSTRVFIVYSSIVLTRVSDPHPFHADPDLGFEKFGDADPDQKLWCLPSQIYFTQRYGLKVV